MIESGSSRLLALLKTPIEEKVPKGWMTARQLAQKANVSGAAMTRLLRLSIDEGKMERRDFRIPVNGGMRVVPHYKLKGL